MKPLVVVSILIANVGSTAAAAPPCERSPLWRFRSLTWFHSAAAVPVRTVSRRAPRSVAIAVHGLNADPDVLNPLIAALNNQGVDVLRLTLSGHGASGADGAFEHVSAERWLGDAACAWREAGQAARRAGVPLLFVGHSLGALVGVAFVSATAAPVDRMTLLAPALSVHPWLRLVLALNDFPELWLPSFAPARERAHDGTPIAAYVALFDLLDGLVPVREHIDVPTLVLVDDADELVSVRGLQRFISTHRLRQWRGMSVRKSEGARDGAYHHLIIGADAVGEHTWRRMQQAIRAHVFVPLRAVRR